MGDGRRSSACCSRTLRRLPFAGVGFNVRLLSVSVGLQMDPQLQQAVKTLFDRIPDVIAAGMLGGAIGGAVLEVLGVRWLLRL